MKCTWNLNALVQGRVSRLSLSLRLVAVIKSTSETSSNLYKISGGKL